MNDNVKIAREIVKMAKELVADKNSSRNEEAIAEMRKMGFKEEVKEGDHDTIMTFDGEYGFSIRCAVKHIGESTPANGKGISCHIEDAGYLDKCRKADHLNMCIASLTNLKDKWEEVDKYNKS